LQQKIDVSVYFPPGTPEEKILDLKTEFENIPNVSSVGYVSQAEALEKFKEDHRDDPLLVESLAELQTNPLQASLNIRAVDTTKFSEIAEGVDQIRSTSGGGIDFSADYSKRASTIDRMTKIIAVARLAGALLSLVLAFIAILVTFNTIRMAIYTARDEINVMRLVGATAWFIRGPFLIEAIIDGVLAAVLTTVIFVPLVWWLSPKILSFIDTSINLKGYFISHLVGFSGILIVTGAVLGFFSSFLAVRRYLKV
jgi:cell division transport system permease protein